METNNSESTEKKGMLYVVSTPIGNWDDITLRAMKILKNCDKIICEEGKEGARILHQYNIHKEIELLNEQNEDERTLELILELEQGKRYALISDCGTPVFADPGFALVKAAISKNIEVSVVPGASSLMSGIVRCGFLITEFLYAGFLSRIKDERLSRLRELSKEKRTVALLETPYRILPFLEAAKEAMPYRKVYIGCNLTMPFETHHYGTFSELYDRFSEMRFKGEFIVIFEGLPADGSISKEWNIESEKRKVESDSRSERDYRNDDRPEERRWDRGNRDFDSRSEDKRPSYSRENVSRGEFKRKPFNSDNRRSSSSSDRFKSDDKRGSSGSDRFKSDDRRSSSGSGRFKSDDRRSSSGSDRFKSDDRRSSSGSDRFKSNDRRSSSGSDRFKSDDRRSSSGSDRFKSNDRRSGSGSDRFKSNDRRSSSGSDRFKSDDRRSSSGSDRFKSDDRRSSSGSDRFKSDDRRSSSGSDRFKSDDRRSSSGNSRSSSGFRKSNTSDRRGASSKGKFKSDDKRKKSNDKPNKNDDK